MKNITELVGVEYPIFQGAMAKISTHELAGAVSEAGGLGIIASGGMTVDELRSEIKAVKSMTSKPFAVNLMLMMPNCGDLMDVVIEEGVKIVTTGAGSPKAFMPKLKEAGIIVIPVVPTVEIAKKMEAIGADAIVAEGTEAGGHIGEISTFPLVAAVTKAVNIPVIAAGGISDARGMIAAFALGAKGIQMGTAFLASEECPIAEAYKERILTSNETSTVVTGRKFRAPVRTIRNQMTDVYLKMEEQDMERDELEKLTIGSLRKAVVEGDVDNGSMMAGQIIGNIHEIKSVKQMCDEIIDEVKNTELVIL